MIKLTKETPSSNVPVSTIIVDFVNLTFTNVDARRQKTFHKSKWELDGIVNSLVKQGWAAEQI